MTSTEPIARRPGPHRSEVGPIELFFDLVYVFAIIQISHLLLEDLTLIGFVHTAIVFAAIWWGWNYTAWMMNWINPRALPVQALSGVLMLLALGMAVSIPGAFEDDGPLFAMCFVAMGLSRALFMIVSFTRDGDRTMAHNYQALGAWSATAGVFWIVGSVLEDDVRVWVWLLALVIDYVAPQVEYRFPGLGMARGTDWPTDPEHLTERNQLVFIIALGESILLMGGTLVEHGISVHTLPPLVIGFATVFSLWWNYFAISGREGAEGTNTLKSAFAYAHALMVGGAILVAVSLELTLTHNHLSTAAVLVAVGGPALYLAGQLLYLRSRTGTAGRDRWLALAALVVIGALALLLGTYLPQLALSLAVLVVMGALALRSR